jgi:hypothetical protein
VRGFWNTGIPNLITEMGVFRLNQGVGRRLAIERDRQSTRYQRAIATWMGSS